MQAIGTDTQSTGDEFMLFTTSRPSRANDVIYPESDLMPRRRRERAWAQRIGVHVETTDRLTLTGSTGTRPPYHFEEGVLDDIL